MWSRAAVTIATIVGMTCVVAAARTAPGGDGSGETTLLCASEPGERRTCAADTKGGVTLVKSTGPTACELGRTWGYDDHGIWGRDGCRAEFSTGQAAPSQTEVGTYTPNAGFTLADTDQGQLVFRLFAVARYLNQQALDNTYVDAFGQTRRVRLRHDLQMNKVIAYFLGWILDPKFRYFSYVWTTNTSQGQGAQVLRANAELIVLRRSPVGALSLPFTVGGNGPVFHTNLELYF